MNEPLEIGDQIAVLPPRRKRWVCERVVFADTEKEKFHFNTEKKDGTRRNLRYDEEGRTWRRL